MRKRMGGVGMVAGVVAIALQGCVHATYIPTGEVGRTGSGRSTSPPRQLVHQLVQVADLLSEGILDVLHPDAAHHARDQTRWRAISGLLRRRRGRARC